MADNETMEWTPERIEATNDEELLRQGLPGFTATAVAPVGMLPTMNHKSLKISFWPSDPM